MPPQQVVVSTLKGCQTHYQIVLLASNSGPTMQVQHEAPDQPQGGHNSFLDCGAGVRTTDGDRGQHFQSRHGRMLPHERLAVQEYTLRPTPLSSLDTKMDVCLS